MPAALVLALLVLAGPGRASPAPPGTGDAAIGPEQVYLTPGRAIEEIFDGAVRADTVTARITPEERDALRGELGFAPPSDSVTVFVPRNDRGEPLGFAVVAEEVGKYRPITFMVGTDTTLEVRDVEVLVYRESRGGEIRHTRFLRQYRGKTPDSSIRTGVDIVNVAGATLSVSALDRGVKRVLATLAILKKRGAL